MNSILLCEGSTDYALLQYFMREVYGWEDKERGPNFLRPVRRLKKKIESWLLEEQAEAVRLFLN